MNQLKRYLVLTACLGSTLSVISGRAQTLPPSTTVPVIFSQSVCAGEVKPGAKIVAKTSQTVFLPNGQILSAGSSVVGHVVEAKKYVFNPAPYAVQQPAALAIHFDTIVDKNTSLPVVLSARAIAGPVASHDAQIPHYRDETDTIGERILIGGDSFSSDEKVVVSPDGENVGYNRKEGVFARLLSAQSANPGSTVRCDATEAEQSMGFFSADACGAYGLGNVALVESGADRNGTFVLESNRQAVTLYAGSTALLEVLAR